MKIRFPLSSRLLGLAFTCSLLSLSACKGEADTGVAAASEGPKGVVKAPAKTGEVSADELKTASDTIAKALLAANENLRIRAIKPTAIPGLYEVQIMGRGIVYMEETGNYFIDGKMLQIAGTEVVNITDLSMVGVRADLLADIKKEDTIVFAPEGEIKASIAVFTDVDCGFCQKLHQEVPALNELGIEVRYLAYPRAGVNSNSYNKITSAWCADNPQEALTRLKNRQEIPMNVCEGNPVASQYEVGQQMGVTGTPSIIMQDGQMIPGYMPAAQLAERIGI
ncbi:DsbC family protein [Teredinibacter purpureus]|uniref:DsbC family protein n=1 Tax=Teredinibacter purpureus TaxID=2731756 RepID=UPI0005F7B384|nr:DsbC family protein [Teredinibacter purpureus]